MKRILFIIAFVMSNLTLMAQDSLQGNALSGNFGNNGQVFFLAILALGVAVLLLDTIKGQNQQLVTEDDIRVPAPLSFEQRLDREIGEFRALDRFSEVGTKVIEKDGVETYILVKKVNKGRIEAEARAAESARKQKTMLVTLGIIAMLMLSGYFYLRFFV